MTPSSVDAAVSPIMARLRPLLKVHLLCLEPPEAKAKVLGVVVISDPQSFSWESDGGPGSENPAFNLER